MSKKDNSKKAQEPNSEPLTPEGVYTGLLRVIYNHELENGRLITPDGAIKELLRLVSHSNKENSNVENPKLSRLNPVSLMRKVHHLAVDIYYETYHKPKKGAPPITKENLDYIYSLYKSGQSYGRIAIKLGLPLDTAENKSHSKDIVRKRLITAKKKLNP